MPLTKEEKKFVRQLGKYIVSIRKLRGMKQKELADILDIADSSLRRIEHGRTNPTTSTLLRIADAFDISFAELFKFAMPTNTKK